MKKITIRFFALLAFFLAAGKITSQCSVSITPTMLSNGSYSFIGSVTPSSITTQYYWSFGNSTTYTATGSNTAFTTYTANGTYTVNLFVMTVPTCSNATAIVITVTNAATSGCNLNANFGYSPGSSGLVNFNNFSTGTVTGTTYSWNFGDNTSPSTSTNPVHTFSANGSYTVTLVATNNMTCTSTKTMAVYINSYCNYVAGFNVSQTANGHVSFVSTSTGTTISDFYKWQFGDNTQQQGFNLTSVNHTYPNGTYNVMLTVATNSINATCWDTIIHTVVVTNNTCNITAAFTQSMGTSGTVNFGNTSSGTSSGTTYTWNFGNGFTSNQANPSITYASNGVYYVTLIASNGSNCTSTTGHTISVTSGSCIANANFTLLPTNTPQYWHAVPAYPWNVTSAMWSWGDNSVSNFSLYASHQYSAAGMYNICLSVTVSCGATASSCATYSVYRGTGAIINVNVVEPDLQNLDAVTVGLTELSDGTPVLVYPNPAGREFYVAVNGDNNAVSEIRLFNITGTCVAVKKASAAPVKIDASELPRGVYFLSVERNGDRIVKKVLID